MNVPVDSHQEIPSVVYDPTQDSSDSGNEMGDDVEEAEPPPPCDMEEMGVDQGEIFSGEEAEIFESLEAEGAPVVSEIDRKVSSDENDDPKTDEKRTPIVVPLVRPKINEDFSELDKRRANDEISGQPAEEKGKVSEGLRCPRCFMDYQTKATFLSHIQSCLLYDKKHFESWPWKCSKCLMEGREKECLFVSKNARDVHTASCSKSQVQTPQEGITSCPRCKLQKRCLGDHKGFLSHVRVCLLTEDKAEPDSPNPDISNNKYFNEWPWKCKICITLGKMKESLFLSERDLRTHVDILHPEPDHTPSEEKPKQKTLRKPKQANPGSQLETEKLYTGRPGRPKSLPKSQAVTVSSRYARQPKICLFNFSW